MDRMPKRKKDRDNPYTLLKENDIYFVFFKSNTEKYKVEISKEIFDVFNRFELEDISKMHKEDKYIERNEVYEETLFSKGLINMFKVEDTIEKKEIIRKLNSSIKKLPSVQKRRLIKYYFDDKTLEKIAKEEGCTKRAIKFSIDLALKKISKKFNI